MAKKLSEIYVDFTGRLGKLKAAMSRAHGIVKKGMTSLAKWAKRGAIALGVGLAAGVALSIKAGAAFESQMAKVATMLDEQTMSYIPKFGRAVKDLAIKFGEATVSITGGLYSILSASIAAGKAIRFLRTAMMAAKGGFTDTATAAYVLTGVMNAYGYAADKVRKVSDILFTIQKKGQTSFAQFAPVLGRVTSIAAAMGVKLEEVAAALATLTRSGISTAESITYLRGLIVSLSGRSKESIKLAKQYGIELSAAALKAKGLTGMLKDLSGLSADVLKDIIKETEARTALSVLIENQTGYLEDLDNVMHSEGETARAQAKVTATLSEKFKSLWQSIKMLAVDMGERFMPMMKSAVDSLIEVFSGMRDELAAIWYAVDEDWREFLDILSEVALIKLEQLAKDLGTLGTKAAEAFMNKFGERMASWFVGKKRGKIFAEYAKQWPGWAGAIKGEVKEPVVDVKAEMTAHKKVADEKIRALLRAHSIERGMDEYAAKIAKERAEREAEGARDKAKADEEDAKRVAALEKGTAKLAEKLAAEREQAIKDAGIERLKNLRDMYSSMKGYEKELARVQKALWREQAKEYAKTGMMTEAAAYAGLAAKGAEQPLREAAGRAKTGFVGFQQAWSQIAGQVTSKRVEQDQLRQLQETVSQLREVNRNLNDVRYEIHTREGGFAD